MHHLRSKCLLCDGASDGNRYVCWCPASYARAFKLVEQPKPVMLPDIRHMFGYRMPDDGRLDFVLMDDYYGEEDCLPDIFGLFNGGTDLGHLGRVEVYG
jgi:hypothetical protein